MRIDRLKFEDVDGYFISSEYNRRYFCGFTSSFGAFIATKGKSYYLTDSRYEEAANAHFKDTGVEVYIVKRGEDAFGVYKDMLSQNEVKRLGVEESALTAEEYVKLSKIDGLELIFKDGEIRSTRAIKTADEIAKIAKVMEISSKAFDRALPFFKAGMSEKELCAEVNYQIQFLGADNFAFDTIVASGINGVKPHAVPSDRRVEKGDFVTFDFGGRLDGYCADVTRTVAFGKITDEQKKAYKNVLKAQRIGLSAIKPGVTAESVDVAVREFLKSVGLEKYFTHSLGHGVGVEIHESPRLAMDNTEILKEGMVVTCEPGIYIPEKFGIRIEDTVVITKDGYKNLALLPKDLIIIKA